MINLELSQQLSKAVKARANECYANAYRGFTKYPQALYVGGMVAGVNDCAQVFSIEHAWLIVDGKIIEPTYCDLESPCSKIIDEGMYRPALVLAYFPIVQVKRKEAEQFARKYRKPYWMKFLFADTYQEAYEQASVDAYQFLAGLR